MKQSKVNLKTKKELKKKVSTQADALEAALDYIEKLQKKNRDLELALQGCEEHGLEISDQLDETI